VLVNGAHGTNVSRNHFGDNDNNIVINGSNGTYIQNNFLYNPATDNINIDNGDGTEIYYNSTYLGTGVAVNNADVVAITDNSFYIGSGGSDEGVEIDSSTNYELDYNNYYSAGGDLGSINGSGSGTIGAWRTALGGCPGSGNECGLIGTSVTDDPQYTAPASGNLYIGASSPLLNIGLNVGVATDIKETARPQGAGYDIGADEWDESDTGIPEFTLTTLLLALFSGLGVIILLNKLQKNNKAI